VHQFELEMQNEELRRAQSELNAERARYFDLYDFAPVGYMVLSEKGLILESNLTAATLLGVPRGAMVQQPISRFVIDEDHRFFYHHINQLFKTGEQQACELRMLKKDRVAFWARIEATAAHISDGDSVCRVVMSDITERKLAEERICKFSQEIIAARENERKQVSSALHHDVGSLAIGISAHLDAVEEDIRSGNIGEALKWIKRTRNLFNESVDHLKDVAVQLRPPELDILGLGPALRQYISQITKRRAARIHFRETLANRRVCGETATILFRVVQESLTNALKHGHAKRVDVNIRASKEQVTLEVRDDGKGFDSSGQGEIATSPLGLRVMREMAISGGGAFTIHSAPGKGTLVRVVLPFKIDPPGPKDAAVPEEKATREKMRSAGRVSRPQIGRGA
jgi:PAS domain S-box-containing protein